MSSGSYAPVPGALTNFVVVPYTPRANDSQTDRGTKTSVRAHAARVSACTRLETTRRRAGERSGHRGRGVFPVRRSAEQADRNQLFQSYQDWRASATVHAHKILGGTIPIALVDDAALGHFLHRFRTGTATERPWVELVAARMGSLSTSSLVFTALQANASALCANDLQQPEFHRHATKQYLSAIMELKALLRSPRWSDSVVLYTSMILTLYECIQSDNSHARNAHVRGVTQLLRQKGPCSFARGLEHKTFRYYRINMLMVSLLDRQPTFLAETEWKTIPFSGDGPPKTMLDLLVDILVEFPGVLAAVETLRKDCDGPYALIQQALKLTCWVRRLIYDLEKWKENHVWTCPTISTTPHLKKLNLLALCKSGSGSFPYDPSLGEALNCYVAAHLILTRIALGFARKSFIIAAALRPPYSLHELIQAIVLVSERHINANAAGMVSLVVTTFALKTVLNTTEVDEEALLREAQELLDQVNASFARKFNIRYSVSFEAQ